MKRLTGKAFLTQSLTASFDYFPASIVLPRSPVQSVTSITYLDTDRVEQTLDAANYFVSPAAIIYPAISASWPLTADVSGAVTVTYQAGYGAAATDVPDPIQEAIKQLAAHFYENREATLVGVSAQELPLGVADLINPYRAWCF